MPITAAYESHNYCVRSNSSNDHIPHEVGSPYGSTCFPDPAAQRGGIAFSIHYTRIKFDLTLSFFFLPGKHYQLNQSIIIWSSSGQLLNVKTLTWPFKPRGRSECIILYLYLFSLYMMYTYTHMCLYMHVLYFFNIFS